MQEPLQKGFAIGIRRDETDKVLMILPVCCRCGGAKAYHIAIGPFLFAVLCTLHPCSRQSFEDCERDEIGLSPV